MDLFSILSVEAFLFVPFVVYFLVYGGGRSLYKGRDIFYPIKYYLAKKVVKSVQLKSKKIREPLLRDGLEPEVTFSTKQTAFHQNISGCDQKGNALKIKFLLWPNKVAEVVLVLKLADGKIFTFPGSQKVHISSIKENKWKINGLIIEKLEPYARLRVVYNGLLQDISCTAQEKIEHVQFNFIFNCCAAPQFFPEDCDTGLLAESLATSRWKDKSWKEFLKRRPNGYEQFGSLFGLVKTESNPDEQVLNLPACRSLYGGPDGRNVLEKEVNIFLADEYGVLIRLNLLLLKDREAQFNFGYVCHKRQNVTSIVDQDIRIERPENSNINIARIKTSDGEEYIFHFNQCDFAESSHKFQSGCELTLKHALCDVNNNQGKALLEFQYYNDTNISIPQLRPILSESKVEVLPEDFIVSIKSNDAKILDITGGKGNSLALLSTIDTDQFLVPDGFIITINAFKRQVFKHDLLQDAMNSINDAFCGKNSQKHEEVCDEAVKLFTNQPIIPEIAKDILNNLNIAKKNSTGDTIGVVSWAVRSSAIGEDSEELSAAGQNETILGCVTEEEILNAVAKCWASLFTYQSVQYRWQHGLPIITDMAVVVQKMVPAEAAGVLFTWHPTTSNPSQMVITSNFGLGESVVSGDADPDTFILNRTYDGRVSLFDQIIGEKVKVLLLTENGVSELDQTEENNTSFVMVNKVNGNSCSLTEEQALKLGRIGVMLEEAFGGPRDIEWAFYKGNLYLLQSRPITTLNSWSEFELTHEHDSVITSENSLYTVANTGEVFPIPCSSLSRSITLKYLDEGMQQFIYNSVDKYSLKCVCVFHHRVMLDCISSIFMNSRTRNIDMSTKVLDLAIFGHPVINEKINFLVRKRLGPLPPFYTLRETTYRWWATRTIADVVEQSTNLVKSLDFKLRDDDDVQTMFKKINKASCAIEQTGYYHARTTTASVFWQMVCMATLVGREKEFNTRHYSDFANILSSCEDVESAEVPIYLEQIAQIIRDEGYLEEFCSIKPELGVQWLQTKCPEAYNLFEEFLSKHGHRCVGEFDIISETWSINPSQLIPMLQANVKHFRGTKKEQKTVDEIINNLETPVNFVTRNIVRYALSKLRVAVGKREQSKSMLILSVHKARLAYRKLAKAMVRDGLIPSEDLICHFTNYELSEVIKQRNPLLISKAMKRQRLYTKWSKLKFPELCYGIPEPEQELFTPIDLVPGTKCFGTPVCNGEVQARACVITHLDEIGELQKGDILITYSTDIGWSPYFPMLSGIVTELGGLVSHGAVVAREYGLPCIVGVKNATQLFKTGDVVYLSGKTGQLGKI
ncbi:putative phosphoenolpyruvate synthase isoform X2 [Anthonomus grandis grandis]|uniref:putative phosphoenolpyruvate synthase isoform X2 n=1 Tax=Anthonomus grandis grandis TaxID=2921223 RepID=UPI0021658501|nr:putative phosphoenolpyruvate synthase isoform X2 [Anthonomus grandis grandis]